MANNTPLRHPSLNSANVRAGFKNRANDPLYQASFTAIDKLKSIYDALDVVRQTEDATLPAESRAMAYRKHYDLALAKSRQIKEDMEQRLSNYETALNANALRQAGLSSPPPNAAELRQALKSMSQQERDQLIADAMEHGASGIISSIVAINDPVERRLLVGHVTTPVDSLTRTLIAKSVPDYESTRQDFEKLSRHLELALDGFEMSAKQLRDPMAEQRGEQSKQEAEAAEQALQEALSGAGLN